jgi:hypothetical protein
VVGAALIVLVVGAGYWFVTEYDTATARCGRGDLGACSVIQAQRQAEAEAAAVQADAERQAAIEEAIALEDERARLGRCYVRARGYDATVRLSGEGAAESCANIANYFNTYLLGGVFWDVVDQAGASTAICTYPWYGTGEQTATVLDTGGAHYGGLACDELAIGPHD